MQAYQREFIVFALANQVLRFGSFTLKSGRQSPYFFNAGSFNSGATLAKLGYYYAATIQQNQANFSVLFGPAYKGIPLATATSIALNDHFQRDVPVTFNRKEAKDHGEGGIFIGAPLQNNVLLIDDVISAGVTFRESKTMIENQGARLSGVIIALNRQERGQTDLSTIEEIEQQYGIPVYSIITLADIMQYLEEEGMTEQLAAIHEYLKIYGVKSLKT